MAVYLDWNATAPLRPEARTALLDALELTGNPSSVHGFGRRCRRLVEAARQQVAALVGADPVRIVFTGGGTEANALALRGVTAATVLVSASSHVSALDQHPAAEPVPVTEDGRLDVASLEARIAAAPGPVLVSVEAVNNETGVIQPLDAIARIVAAHGALLHVDAAQAAGRMHLDMAALGIDLLTLSAHKLGGPQGVGALAYSPRAVPTALLRGGGQERRLRAGTENVAGIAGFGAAATAALAGLPTYGGLALLRDDLESRLGAAGAVLFGAAAPRVANTACLAMPGVASETQLMAFDLAGIAVSAGAACSSGKVGASHVLRAMGVDADLARSAIRVSLGWTTTPAEVDRFVSAWLAQRSGERSPPWPGASAGRFAGAA